MMMTTVMVYTIIAFKILISEVLIADLAWKDYNVSVLFNKYGTIYYRMSVTLLCNKIRVNTTTGK